MEVLGIKPRLNARLQVMFREMNTIGTFDIKKEHLAYALATAYHETAFTLLPIEEYGEGRNKKYGRYYDIDGTQYRNLHHVYYGRGYAQLTWLTNYKKAKDKLGVDFVNKPWLACEPHNALKILIIGMQEGWFTGKKLSDFDLYCGFDYVGARRIINGQDKAQEIAKYAQLFFKNIIIEEEK